MFDIGWTELLVIGVVALIVVGPKDLPVMFHKLGQFTAKARGMAREFQRAMDDAAKEAGVNDVSRDLRNITSPQKLGLDKLREATRDLASVDPKKGPATRKLQEERAEQAAKVRDTAAEAAATRKAAEAAKASEPKAPEAGGAAKAAASAGDGAPARPAKSPKTAKVEAKAADGAPRTKPAKTAKTDG